MADVSAEPSMEDILSSIKRIIAEEGDAPARAKRTARPAAGRERDDEVLELSHRLQDSDPVAAAPEPATAAPAPEPISIASAEPVAVPTVAEAAPEPIVSRAALEASRGSLDALSRMVVRPEAGGDGTLEGLVRDMLRPMLRDWLDAHLPALVEAMVAREIARIAGAER